MTQASSSYSQIMDKYYEAAAAGDVESIKRAVQVMTDPNKRNEKGWTALMFAARNGHAIVVETLIENGSDMSLINSTGHTALDIAKFWNHKEVIRILSPDEKREEKPLTQTKFPPITNHFCGSVLDRAAHRRKDQEWIDHQFEHKKSKIVVFKDLNAVAVQKPDLSETNKLERFRLFTTNWEELNSIGYKRELYIFLGCETKKSGVPIVEEIISWFAIDAAELSIDAIQKIHPHAEVVNAYPGLMQLSDNEAAISAQSRTMLAWHDRYQFCPTCGSATASGEAGWKRTCQKEDCRSRKGVHNTSYPRSDPTAIMAVVSPDGKQVLLGRSKRFPRNLWSCLAGFMEPGESIEETCRRETFEEAGIHVDHVDYHSTQPWPMPASLMIGCIAYATTTDIKVDKEELEEARWFSRQDAIQMLTHQHPKGLFCPPQQAIAHQLILAWVNMTSNL